MKRLLFVLALLCGSAWAQGSFYQFPNPLPNAVVTVCSVPPNQTPCTNTVSIFSNQALSSAIANPFEVGSTGNFGFWVTPGQYQIQVGSPYNLNYTVSLGGGGGGGSFSTITGGTNTNTLVVGTGGSLSTSGTGTVSATSVPSSVFVIGNTPCAPASTNCLQWVDDDSTDNCGSATTTFMASVNAYAGPGVAQVNILGSSSGKAYKLTACNLIFTNLIGVHINLWATIDCAMALQSCIQFGPTATSGSAYTGLFNLISFRIKGPGTIVGGHSLTGSGGNGSGVGAGIYVMPHAESTIIDGISFAGTGTNKGFGVNGAMGTCSTYAIMFDSPLPDGAAVNNFIAVNSSSTTSGSCGIGNPSGAAAGSNTIMILDNVIYTAGAASGSGFCGSVGINDGGSFGHMDSNNVFGFGIPVFLSGVGHQITANAIDTTQCTAGGVSANIQVGGSTAVGPVGIIGNIMPGGTNHAGNLISLVSGSTATLLGWTITNNQANLTGVPLLPITQSCIPLGNAMSCLESGNQNLVPVISCASGTQGSGWQSGQMLASCFPAAQTANLGATNLLAVPTAQGPNVMVSCEIILTRAATTSSTLPTCNVTYTSSISGLVVTAQITPAWAASTSGCVGSTTNTVGNECTGTIFIDPTSATTMTFSTSNYASVGATTMQYQPYITVARTDR